MINRSGPVILGEPCLEQISVMELNPEINEIEIAESNPGRGRSMKRNNNSSRK
jgi:hypothetical protein